MSLTRLVYYSAVVGGWAAFVGWLMSELLFFRSGQNPGSIQVVIIGCIVGAAIGAGLNTVAGMANGQLKQLLQRTLPGLIGGGIGGAGGALIGNLLFSIGFPRALSWAIMGLGIGVIEGLYERSPSKIRNGIIGGGVGGLIGGFLFDPISTVLASASGMSSRATAFVILGVCIGALVGLAQVVLKEAWLTVLDGYRAGRQLILSQSVTSIGRAEYSPLPFLGELSKDLELDHARICRHSNGNYFLEDNQTKLGTIVNGQSVRGQTPLKDGDVIKLGRNFIRFNERKGSSGTNPVLSSAPVPVTTVTHTPPPPPSPKTFPQTTAKTSSTPAEPHPLPRPIASAVPNTVAPPPVSPVSQILPAPTKPLTPPPPPPIKTVAPPPAPSGTPGTPTPIIRPISPPPPPPPRKS